METTSRPRSLKEKLLYLCLLGISVFYSSQALQQLMDVSFSQRTFLQLSYLQDVDLKNITITTHTASILRLNSLDLINRATVIQANRIEGCTHLLINNIVTICTTRIMIIN